jgi:hypothetical protein
VGLNHENLLQRSRFELKYLITEKLAVQVRQFARNYLVPDPYAKFRADGSPGYGIYSVYLDNPSLDLMAATVHGHKNRFKLRARYYDENPQNPVYFEIKGRVNDAILKQRAKVRREVAARLLVEGVPHRSDLVDPEDTEQYVSLRRFCELRSQIRAKPQCIVAYDREAWMTADGNSARLTFDRALLGGPYRGQFTATPQQDWVKPDVAHGIDPRILLGVVLELKFTDRFPNWMRELVRVFDLTRTCMAKYVTCTMGLSYKRALHEATAAANRRSPLPPSPVAPPIPPGFSLVT